MFRLCSKPLPHHHHTAAFQTALCSSASSGASHLLIGQKVPLKTLVQTPVELKLPLRQGAGPKLKVKRKCICIPAEEQTAGTSSGL